MNKIVILFLALQSIMITQKANTQPWMYTEQNSGVTSSLNSAAMSGEYFPVQAWVCGDSGVVLKTTNSGTNWIRVGTGVIPSAMKLINICFKSNDSVLVSGISGNTAYVYITANGGTNWTQVFTQANGKINAIWMRNTLNGIMTGDPVGGRWSLWNTSNGGVNWDSTGMYLPQVGSEKGFDNSLSVMFNQIWFGTNNTRLYRSSNYGANWQSVTTGAEFNSTAVWNYWDTTAYSFVLFGGNNVSKSTNNGQNWFIVNVPDTGRFVGFCPGYYGVLDYGPSGAYAVRNNNKIYFSNFNITNFVAEFTAPSGYYNHMACDKSRFYFGYGGETWAVRSNGGITKISLYRGGSVRSISNVIPTDYRLEQNYPNPFNPETRIRFSIPRLGSSTSMVSITIYDMQGREVERPLSQMMTPGEYELSYTASKLASGVYFYKLVAGDYAESKKMILVK